MRPRATGSLVAGSLLVLVSCGGASDADPGADAALADSSNSSDAAETPPSLATTGPTTTSTTVAPTQPTTAPSATEPAVTDVPPGTTAPGGDPLDTWESPDGIYAIAFPAEPSKQNLQAPLPDGTSLPVTAYLAEVGGAAAITSCVVYPDGTVIDETQVLDAARDGALANLGAELVDSTPIEQQGRPGVEYRGAIGEAGALLGRTFLDGLQLCQALVVGEPAIVGDIGPSFLESFEFLQEAA